MVALALLLYADIYPLRCDYRERLGISQMVFFFFLEPDIRSRRADTFLRMGIPVMAINSNLL